jgi:hypothetical protein
MGRTKGRRGTEKADRQPSRSWSYDIRRQALAAFESNLRLFTEYRDALLSVKRPRQ